MNLDSKHMTKNLTSRKKGKKVIENEQERDLDYTNHKEYIFDKDKNIDKAKDKNEIQISNIHPSLKDIIKNQISMENEDEFEKEYRNENEYGNAEKLEQENIIQKEDDIILEIQIEYREGEKVNLKLKKEKIFQTLLIIFLN